tara:strand:- start:1203 stop:1628 length:426 start_codon:yes stop_codon:yes gene_type:complete
LLNSKANLSVHWSFLPILLLSLLGNIQPWGMHYVPIGLPVLICAICLSNLPIFLIWLVGLFFDLCLGLPMGFHGAVAIVCALLCNQLQEVSNTTTFVFAFVGSLAAVTLLSSFGYPLNFGVLTFSALAASIATALALWVYH